MLQDKIEKNLFNELQQGVYKNHYLIYCRKSTDEPNNQKNSILYQKKENLKYAKRKQLPIASFSIKNFCAGGIVSERHSGFKEDDNVLFTKDGLVQYRIERLKFQKMLEFVGKGYVKGVIALSWDRMSRNEGDDTIVRKLMRKGVDVQFSYTTYEKTSSGELHMDIDGMFARHRSRVTSEKVTLATRNLRERGICTYRAPIGYLNTGEMDNKPFDDKRVPQIRELFKRYATGNYSLSDLQRYAKQENLTTVPMRRRRTLEEMLAEEEDLIEIPKRSRPLSANSISRILSNPFYIGKIIDSDGCHIDSKSHDALIDIETFRKVQYVLKQKTTSTFYEKLLPLPYRGFVRCGECRRAYTPYTKKGQVYYGSRCKSDCENTLKSLNLSYIEVQTKRLISSLYFKDRELMEFEAIVQTNIALLEEKRRSGLETIERKKNRLRDKLAYLNSNKLSLLQSGVYTLESYIDEQAIINTKIVECQNEEEISDIAMRDLMKDIVRLSEQLKNLTEYYDFAKTSEKEEILKLLFSELFISDNTLKYKAQTGVKFLETRFVAVCDQKARISEPFANITTRVAVCDQKARFSELLHYRSSIKSIIKTIEIILL